MFCFHGNSTDHTLFGAQHIPVAYPQCDSFRDFLRRMARRVNQPYAKVFGHSFGGHVAIRMLPYTNEVNTLYLCGTPPLTGKIKDTNPFVNKTGVDNIQLLLTKDNNFTRAEAVVFVKAQGLEEKHERFDAMVEIAMSDYATNTRKLVKMMFADDADELEILRVFAKNGGNVVFVHPRDDLFVNPAHIKKCVELIPNAKYIEVPHGHLVPLYNKELNF